MPRIKTSLSEKINEIVAKHPKQLERNGDKVLCKLCLCEISFDSKHGKDNVLSHLKTKNHIKNVETRKSGQSSIVNAFQSVEKLHLNNEFFVDITRMLIETNIPIEKLENQSFRHFMSKYTNRELPNAKNIRRNYVPTVYEEVIDKIRENIGSDAIYLIVDETSDVKNRYVVNILVGALNGQPIRSMLLSTTFIERTNNKTVNQCIIDSLNKLWCGSIHYERLQLVVSDQASYLLKGIKHLKTIFPNLNHITCIVHALHRVVTVIREDNNEVNEFISLFKQIMAKSPLREHQFHEQTNLPMPPKPVLSRWNTWLLSAFYYSENYAKVKLFIEELPESSEAIRSAKRVIKSKTLEESLINLTDMKFITEAINQLQNRSLKTREQLNILNEVKSKLNGRALQKLEKSLAKNPDIYAFTSDSNEYDFKYKTRYAPIVSCDVERSFSKYKEILSDKRQNMTTETIQHLNVICFNSFLNEK
jgi:hypothetical protein